MNMYMQSEMHLCDFVCMYLCVFVCFEGEKEREG